MANSPKAATRLPVMDDLEKFHQKNMSGDLQGAIARQLLDLGEAVARLREGIGMTRGELGKHLRVKARDIAIIEEQTPRAPAGLLEEALNLLVRILTPSVQRQSEVWLSLQAIHHLRPALVPAWT